MTSTFVPGDMEFFNVQIQATRPDGNDLVPFWVTTKENLVCLFTLMLILILCKSVIGRFNQHEHGVGKKKA